MSWYPGIGDYVEWAQEESFLSYFNNSPDKQAIAIRRSISEQSEALSESAREIVASNRQIQFAVEEGFSHLAQINKAGFREVTSGIEAMQSDMNYSFGLVIKQMEFQNEILGNILRTLQNSFRAEVHELYNHGLILVAQENYIDAIQYFKESIAIKTGEHFFPSHYNLGRLYLSGNGVIDLMEATKFLLRANKLGEDNFKIDKKVKSILADCKFYLSQAYYFQLSGWKKTDDLKLTIEAIKYAKEAVELNKNLSQGYFHLAKYYAHIHQGDRLLYYLQRAIEIDRNYSLIAYRDGVFKQYEEQITELINQLRISKYEIVSPQLQEEDARIARLKQKDLSQFPELHNDFLKLTAIFQSAKKELHTNTYFGVINCEAKLKTL